MGIDGRRLANTSVLDAAGHPVRLGDLWTRSSAVVVWLRHYGCLFCREQAAEFRARSGDMEDRGALLVFVGNGEPRYASEFRDQHCPDCTLLTDPDLASYRVIGARSGLLNTVGPQAWGAAVRALSRGARQKNVRGSPFQQGGVLVIAPGDDVVYSYLSKAAGDHPRVDDVIAAIPAPASVRSAATR